MYTNPMKARIDLNQFGIVGIRQFALGCFGFFVISEFYEI
jgi:hypothetical protein